MGNGDRGRLTRLGRPRWAGIAVAIGAFVGLTLYIGPGDIRKAALPPELARQPDAYLEDATITQFRTDGALHYRMRIEQATYFGGFDEGGTADVVRPIVDFFAPPAPPWRIEAAAGEIRQVATDAGSEEERADLVGDVVLSQVAADGARTELRTSALRLYPSRELIRGSQPVTIERGSGNRTTAAGFEADLASGRIRLFSDADRRVAIVVQPTEFD